MKRPRPFLTKLHHFVRDRKGVAAFEFAIIVPLLALLYFGTVDLSNWYLTHRRLVIAGSSIADITTQSQGQVTKQQVIDMWNNIGKIIVPVKLSDVALTMRAYRKSGGTVKQQWPLNTGNGQCPIDPSATDLQSMGDTEMTDGNDILVVAVCTTVEPIALQAFGWKAIPLRYQITMRPRAGKQLDCSDCS